MPGMSRRDALSTALLIVGAAALEGQEDATASSDSYSDAAAADRWVRIWSEGQRPVSGALVLQRFADPMYIVRQEIAWTPDPSQADRYDGVTVPPGFVTDFASIPRVFWSVLRPDGDYGYAAIVHDYLYWEQPVERRTADQILRFAMQDFEVDSVTINLIYNAVRAGGSSAWRDNARLKAAGEKRVLRRFPDNPTVRWSSWKNEPGVF